MEVMIAIALLALMGIAIAQVTVRSSRITFMLGGESTEYVATVLSLQSVESDLSQIFSPVFASPKTANGAVATVESVSAANPPEFWSLPVRKDGIRRSRLQGSKEKLTFVTNGNRRVEADSPQSDFLRITWEIERNSSGAYSLYRTADWDAFLVEGGLSGSSSRKPTRVALLENMASAKFSYYRVENKTWEDTWDTEGRFVKPEFRFPDLISLKIEVPDPSNTAKQMQWNVVIRPNMQLNEAQPKPAAIATGVEGAAP